MFSSSPLDKNCVASDNFSSGRSNATRFPVGVTSLGDENQQIRIQLAVHKYNSSPNGQLNSRTSLISPVRHSFLKNSLKAKNFEGDPERTSKIEKKNGNKYEGVGAFPTIHLKKSAVRYRPIRRYNDVKIPYPELPVNRFLSNLPEVNSDSKSSARSVLDVLENLSGKKIHPSEENKPKNKGLGGDYLSNSNTVYKPLFVQKPKIGSILTRDNTTQTLSPADTETSSPQSNNSFTKNDAADPKAELRKKLAKQNNEIFASLSSSISSSFAVKRKIDKVVRAKDDDHVTEESASKKSKISDHQYKNHTDSGDSGISKPRVKSTDAIKLNRKSKINEANSPTSPNKDRLTTIFLDMRSTSPKAQIFEGNAISSETSMKKPTENGLGSESRLSNGFATPPVSSFESEAGSKTTEISQNTNESDVKSSTVNEKFDSLDGKKKESEECKPMFNFPVNKSNSPVKSVPSGFQFSISGTSNFSFQKTTPSSETSTNTGNNLEKNNVQAVMKPLASGSKPDFSSFKFGAEGNLSSLKDPDSPKPQISVPITTAPSTMPQFNFGAAATTGTTAIAATAASIPSAVSFGVTVTQSTTLPKPMFTFGQNTTLSQPTAKDEEKVETCNPVSNSTTQNIPSSAFSFGQKNAESLAENQQQTTASLSAPTSNIGNLSSGANVVSTDSVTGTQNGKSLFTFGQKTETPTTSSSPVTLNQEQKFGFSFGQKPDTLQSNPEGFGQKSSSLFFFGEKSTTQESSQSTTAITNVTSPSQAPVAQTTSLFGQNPTQATSAPTFEQSATPQPSNMGAKSEADSVSSATVPTNIQNNKDFQVKTPLFTTSASVFGTTTTTTQASTEFGSTTTSASGFKFGASTTTQSQPTFGVSSAPQTMPVFGASSTSQSLPSFGSSSTTQTSFGAPVSNSISSFGISRQPSFTFGIASTTQTTPSFGVTSATQTTPAFEIPSTAQSTSVFGASSTSLSTTGFGTTSTTQSTSAFGSSGFGAPSSQPSTAFGAPTSTQSGLQFGTPTSPDSSSFGAGFSTASSTLPNNTFGASTATSTSGFGTSQTSFNQPFGSKPPVTSLGQTSGIFGQNTVPSFSSNTAFSSNQNSVFGQKSNTGGNLFDQNKIQQPGFGAAAQPFGTQNKFSFGMSTSNATGFTTSPPNTTAAPVFSFGGNSTGNTFTFGSNGSGSTNTQTPFAFKTPTNEPFKFGAPTTKEGPGFGAANTSAFAFNSQMNNNAIAEQKPAFNFGNTQVSSSSPFNFGTTPSPSVFSFGGSTSSASSGSSFNFGTPTPGGPFGQTPTATPGAPFAVPGTFSIGSGSSQSRPRATSRPRRRP